MYPYLKYYDYTNKVIIVYRYLMPLSYRLVLDSVEDTSNYIRQKQ